MKNIHLTVCFSLLINSFGCLENTISTDLNNPSMRHDTLSVSSITAYNYQTPPNIGNSTLLYLGRDSSGFENPFAIFKVQSNSINSPETFDTMMDLSLIHISEPTRPY